MKSTAEISPYSVLRSEILSLALFTTGLSVSHHPSSAFTGRERKRKKMGIRKEGENGDPEIAAVFFIVGKGRVS